MYGRDESVTGNCHIRIAFAPNRPDTAELLSKMAGVTTIQPERATFPGDCFDLLMNKQCRTRVESHRQLVAFQASASVPTPHQAGFGNLLVDISLALS